MRNILKYNEHKGTRNKPKSGLCMVLCALYSFSFTVALSLMTS